MAFQVCLAFIIVGFGNIMKPWTKISDVPLNHWFVSLYPNGEIGPYYQRIINVRFETMIEVEFSHSWWDISALLGKYKHVANIGDKPMDCGIPK